MTKAHLEIDEDLAQQRIEWRLEWFGGWVAVAIITLGLLGAFGSGILSSTSKLSQNNLLKVAYERFGRRSAPDEVRVSLSSSSGSKTTTLWIENAFLDSIEIESLIPDPKEMIGLNNKTAFVFDNPGQLEVQFQIRFRHDDYVGVKRWRLGFKDEEVEVIQFIYP